MQITNAAKSDMHVAHCVDIDRDGFVRLHIADQDGVQRAWVSHDIDLNVLRGYVSQGSPALVTQAGRNMWLITAFMHAPARVAASTTGPAAPTVLRADMLELGGGAARMWVEGRTLHLRAFHMNLRAEGQQRLVGATIALG